MKILIAGGTGFIGSILLPVLLEDDHQISMIIPPGRKHKALQEPVEIVEGDVLNRDFWPEPVQNHQIIINLAGSSIFRRWNKRVRRDIYLSRILTTRNIVSALKASTGDKKQFFSASGVGYYGYGRDELLNEESDPGGSFLARVAVEWETEALKARGCGARTVLCRFGIVMGKDGGAFKKMLPFFKYWCGGSWGGGEQWFSWIHGMDCARAFLFLLEHSEIEGAVNFTAPNPVTNGEMAHLLRKGLRRRTPLPTIPGFLIRAMLGEFSDVFLKGQRAMPGKLLAGGFQFRYPCLEGCLSDLLGGTAKPAM